MAFHVGQKVVCVNDAWFLHGGEFFPVKRGVYTIRGIETRFDLGLVCATGLFLSEIVNQPRHYLNGFHECSFAAAAFRPVVERKTDTGFAVLETIRREASHELEPALTHHHHTTANASVKASTAKNANRMSASGV